MADFKTAFKITSGNEGGYCNVDGDSGGETYCGIARNSNPNWKGWAIVDQHKPLHFRQILSISELESLVESFYKENYWNKVNGDSIPIQDLANQVYDMAVNSGVSQAKKLLS